MKRVPLSLSGNDEEDAEEAILQRVLHVSQLSAAAEEQHLATAAIVEEAAVEADEAEPAQEKKAIEKEAHQEATVRVDATASEDSNEKGAGDLNFELAPMKCPIADPAMNVVLQHTSACIRLAGNDAWHREANICGLQHSAGSKIDSVIRAAAVGSKLEEEVHVHVEGAEEESVECLEQKDQMVEKEEKEQQKQQEHSSPEVQLPPKKMKFTAAIVQEVIHG